eukprot:6460149-Amphidinium_carterae.2
MWGIVETLGLKDGLSEFTDQFNKDAKVTIANQQWAKDRGIDVEKLNAWEKDLQKQRDDLSKRTIGAAVDALAKECYLSACIPNILQACDYPPTLTKCILRQTDSGQKRLPSNITIRDETLAHLLEIRPVSNENDGDYEDESDVDWDDDDEISLSSGPTASRRPTAHFDLWAVREPLGGDRAAQPLINKATPPATSVSTTDAGSGDSHVEESK